MDRTQLALAAWRAITAILVTAKATLTDELDTRLKTNTPQPHVVAVQLILMGAGFATAGLIPDGQWGEQSRTSLEQLHHELVD